MTTCTSTNYHLLADISYFLLKWWSLLLLFCQESSVVMGLSYVISSVSIFDEYTNDVLDMAPGSCFPRYNHKPHCKLLDQILNNWRFLVLKSELSRLKYRKNEDSSHGGNLSKPASFDKEKHEGKKPLTRVTSFKNSMDEFNPFKVIFLPNTLVLVECPCVATSLKK